MAPASGSPIGRTNQVHPELVTPGTPSSPEQNRLNRQPPPPDSWRKAIYQTFEDPSYNKTAKVISVGMMLIIMVSTLAFIFESELLIGGSLYDSREDAKVSIRPRRGQRACRAVPPHHRHTTLATASPPAPSSHAAAPLAAAIRPYAALAPTHKDAAACTATAPPRSPRPNPRRTPHARRTLTPGESLAPPDGLRDD